MAFLASKLFCCTLFQGAFHSLSMKPGSQSQSVLILPTRPWAVSIDVSGVLHISCRQVYTTLHDLSVLVSAHSSPPNTGRVPNWHLYYRHPRTPRSVSRRPPHTTNFSLRYLPLSQLTLCSSCSCLCLGPHREHQRLAGMSGSVNFLHHC